MVRESSVDIDKTLVLKATIEKSDPRKNAFKKECRCSGVGTCKCGRIDK